MLSARCFKSKFPSSNSMVYKKYRNTIKLVLMMNKSKGSLCCGGIKKKKKEKEKILLLNKFHCISQISLQCIWDSLQSSLQRWYNFPKPLPLEVCGLCYSLLKSRDLESNPGKHSYSFFIIIKYWFFAGLGFVFLSTVSIVLKSMSQFIVPPVF